MNKKRNTIVDIGILIVITLVTYFPVSFFLFSLKNDSLVQYLPFRYHLSESIQHGFFPYWSPYLYTGFPIHADMQGMTWNPVVLLISLFTRYNMSVLELEVTIYLVLSAIGMYSLLKSFSINRLTCVLAGVSYMSCGFINGSASVIPWISSAAFIPFVFLGLKIFLERPVLRNAIVFALALSLLFVCGYPTFFIYTCYLVAALLIYLLIINRRALNTKENKKRALYLFLSAIIFLVVCSPAIISYIEFLPYYSRGAGITAAKAAENPSTPYSSISFFVPNAVHKDHVWLKTDTSMRNHYVGLFVIGLFGLSLFFKKNYIQKFLLGITIFSFLLSLGSFTPLHKMAYSLLPLFNTFRHPGNIRLFTSFGIILLAALFIQQLLSREKNERNRVLSRACYVLLGILILPVIYALFFESGVVSNIFSAIKTKQPKLFLDTLRFPSMLLLIAVIQVSFTLIMIYLLKRDSFNKRLYGVLIGFNSILFCWLALPFNFISQLRTKEVNNYVSSFPDGYPLPDLSIPAGSGIFSDSSSIPIYGYPNFYSKQISIQDHVITPTLNSAYEEFNNNKKLRLLLKDYPFAWLNDTIVATVPDSTGKKFSYGCYSYKNRKDTSGGSLKLVAFNPNKFVFDVNSSQATVLTLLQQFNFNWRITVNNEKAQMLRMNQAFIGVSVPQGNSTVVFNYKPVRVIMAVWISLILLLIILAYLLFTASRIKRG